MKALTVVQGIDIHSDNADGLASSALDNHLFVQMEQAGVFQGSLIQSTATL